MKCFYKRDKELGKVLIPGCMAVAISNDIQDCTCTVFKKGSNIQRRKSGGEKLIDILWEVKEGKTHPNKAYKEIINL